VLVSATRFSSLLVTGERSGRGGAGAVIRDHFPLAKKICSPEMIPNRRLTARG